jgi:hypothetical protein
MVSAIDREGRDANTFIKNHHGFRDFSIEGEQWDYYYPTDAGSLLENIFIGVLGPHNNNYSDLINTVGPFDGLLDQLRFEIGLEKPSNTDPRILRLVQFPPFIDSFALPRETKMSVKLDTGEYRSIPLLEILSKKTPEDFSPIGSFTTLCHSLDAVRDLQNDLNGISSHCYPSKSYGSMSYIYRNLIDPRPSILNLVLGIYYPLPGTKKAILERILNLLETLKRKPELSKREIDLTQYCSLFTNNGLRLNPQNNFEEIKQLQYEVSSHYGEQIIDVDISYVKGGDHSQKKKVKILCSDFSRLNNQLNRLDACNTDLLLPGPVPMFYFDDDTPKITRGFDVIYRPLRKIVFLTYPGNNLKRCVSQLNMMADIAVGPLSSPFVKNDLKTSLTNNPHMFTIKEGDLDKCPGEEVEIDFDTPEDNVVDSSVLMTFASSKSIDEINQVLTLNDIWKSISTTPSSAQKRYESNKENDILSIQVEFVQDARKDIILLNANTYVRKIVDGKNSEVLLSRNVQSGDLIAYLRSDDRESLDNLFIRSFSESRSWTLEQVLEPFTCLHYFYESIRRIDFEENFDELAFCNCYWLSIEQKRAVYDSLGLLLNNNIDPEEFVVKFRKSVERFKHWQELGKLNDEGIRNLKTSFNLTKGIGPDKVHSIAVLFGLDYDVNSFKSLLSKLRTGGKHYYFQKPKNLLAIGKLIGYPGAFDRYDNLTEAGKEIRTVLELEGLSISRVISGNDNPMNAMDDLIRKRMVICRVLEVSQPSVL